MKIQIKKSELSVNINNFMRKCGYAPFHDSYIKVLSGSGYPRFHIYVNDQNDQYVLNLHLDQKRPSYGKQTAHSGEYDGKVVEGEGERIENLV
ncbi:MAG: hypothetical protein KAQ64_02985 [Candidatus Pacebacteria bacterium]|nr:hypothetical protein [Candidatus Paceibacterota bacterium]